MYLLTVISIIVIGSVLRSIARTRDFERQYDLPHNLSHIVEKCFCGAVAIALLTTLISLVVSICHLVPSVAQTNFSAKLVAMTSSDGSSGAFVMGTGKVENGVNYLVYIGNKDGSVAPSIIKADETVRIIEDASLTDTGTWIQYIMVPDKKSLMYNWTVIRPEEYVWRNELRVPPGTVRQNFSAN